MKRSTPSKANTPYVSQNLRKKHKRGSLQLNFPIGQVPMLINPQSNTIKAKKDEKDDGDSTPVNDHLKPICVSIANSTFSSLSSVQKLIKKNTSPPQISHTENSKCFSENIVDIDQEQTVPEVRNTHVIEKPRDKINSEAKKRHQNNAYPIPRLEVKTLKDAFSRAKSVSEISYKHHFPPSSNIPHTLTKLSSAKVDIIKTSNRFINETIIKKQGFLYKYSEKGKAMWKSKYCVLKPNTFIYSRLKIDKNFQGCIQFDLIPCKLINKDSTTFQ